MATQISIPSGVNPNAAIPASATVAQHSNATPDPRAAVMATVGTLAPADEQTPGFVDPSKVAAPAVPADQASQFAAFLEWQKTQTGATAPAVVPPAAAAKPAAPAAPDFIGADESVLLAKSAAASDPTIAAAFSLFSLAAPDVDLGRAIGTALDRGDASLIDTRYLTEVGGDKARQLLDVAKGLVDHVTAQVAGVTNDIHSAAGGEAQWNAAVAVFNQSAPQYMRQAVADAMNSADRTRIQAATKGLLEFAKSQGSLPVHPEGHVRAGGGAPDAALGLSKAEYQAERQKLDPRARDYEDKERELTARRQMGKNQGK